MAIVIEPELVKGLVEMSVNINLELAKDVAASGVKIIYTGDDYAYTKGARAILRGLRAVSDFEYEFQLALMNRRLEREVETVFLMTGFRWIFISSSIIKDAARHGGDVSGLVPDHVCEMLRERFLAG